MNSKDFFTHLAEKAGIDVKDAKFTEFLDKQKDLDIPDIFDSVKSKLMNEDDAKKLTTIISHFKQQNLAGVDTELERAYKEHGLSDADIAELKSEKSTFQRVPMMINKIKAKEEKKYEEQLKVKGGDKDVIKKYTDEIDELKSDVAKAVETAKSNSDSQKSDYEGQLNDMALSALLGSRTYANDKITRNVNIKTAHVLVNDKLKEKGALLVRDGNSFKLVSADNPETPYREKHEDVKVDDFIDDAVSAILKVSDSTSKDENGKLAVKVEIPADQKVPQELIDFADAELAKFDKQS